MADVFISYRSTDIEKAKRVQEALDLNGIDSWFAPVDILDGDDFADEISAAINACRAMVVLVSKEYMTTSPFSKKELKLAITKQKQLYTLRIDHEPLTPDFDLLLIDEQQTAAYQLPKQTLNDLVAKLKDFLKLDDHKKRTAALTHPISCSAIKIMPIDSGDPYYEEGNTLKTNLTKLEFYLSPPRDGLTEEQLAFLDGGSFAAKDTILDTSLEDIAAECKILNLIELIEESRKKVFNDFFEGSNGCYFNNKKYGINRIRPFRRTEDISEDPCLTIEFYKTDYYTHRVMKDVCKKICAESPNFCAENISFHNINPYRILFTSLGVNLLLFDTKSGIPKNTLICARSTNSTETYGQVLYGVSVIEGVSESDRDDYTKAVLLSNTAQRGLLEELKVEADKLLVDSLRFYDLFVNLTNLEIGISCSVELKAEYTIEEMAKKKGKDDNLEIAAKNVQRIDTLFEFLCTNLNSFMNQAAYTIGSYLETLSVHALCDNNTVIVSGEEEEHLCSKRGEGGLCGDAIFKGNNYYAIIDGNTPKGSRLWDGLPSDVYVARYLCDQMAKVDEEEGDLSAEKVIDRLNKSLLDCYQEGEFEDIPVEERLSASILIYSLNKRELWSFGECQYRIEGIPHRNDNPINSVLANLRSFYLETELKKGKTVDDLLKNDTGREAIMPFLKRQMLLANEDCPFGYDLLDGGDIQLENIKKLKVIVGNHVVMASDGYPVLCETYEESEQKLKEVLEKDPLCMYENKQTKAMGAESVSYDDRCFLSFIAK